MNTDAKIALSFDVENEYYRDDSWLPETMETLLNLLKKNNSTATFFVVGYVVEKFPELVKAIANAGH